MAPRTGMARLAFNAWNLVAYQIGWFACVLGAAADRPWQGPVVVTVLCTIHIALMRDRMREVYLLALSGLFGFGVDSFQAYLGAFAFLQPMGVPWLAPVWLVTMWVLFATTLHGCLAWLQGRYLFGALLGLIGGPLSYWGGERLGAVRFGPSLTRDLFIVGLVWAVATPILLVFARLTGGPYLGQRTRA